MLGLVEYFERAFAAGLVGCAGRDELRGTPTEPEQEHSVKDTRTHDEDAVIKPGAKLSGNDYVVATATTRPAESCW
ncbi:hypothetical protein NN3_05470 [Nocardia neocaledoniensis NBRC 108232]|nr:hypothetical protein NN3_05470 [Nocardia neocaledoniensis NBRC 108232]